MFESVLIANRGEIACRIVRTAKRLGLRTIAVHSEADAGALFTTMADEAHLIGRAPPGESYLVVERIIGVAKRTGAACIHPGYGFLSERAEFAEACAASGITFVGPPASVIRAMGLKDAAKTLVSAAGVPVVPGYHGVGQEPDVLRRKADEIGYPVLIKAVAGGGGKGMRRVDRAADFLAALEGARREAQGAFGDPRVLIEKHVPSPRHVEMQVFADAHGNVVHLFERDCSLQRRHQKVIEEAPAPGMTAEMRATMGNAAVAAARAVGYVGAGTVEFIADAREGFRTDRFYFMEMNTRLQVEHPVTEAITGLDLVELQFRVAAGERLPVRQDDLRIDGHAVEARLYAEDPERGFLPSTGKLWVLRLPQENEWLRIDTGVVEGDDVTPFYDPLIAKIVTHGETRDEALDKMSIALRETIVAGPKTNAAFLEGLCNTAGFREGSFNTGFIDELLARLGPAWPPPLDAVAIAAGVTVLVENTQTRNIGPTFAGGWYDPWTIFDGFQLPGEHRAGLDLVCDGQRMKAALHWKPGKLEIEIPALGYRGSVFMNESWDYRIRSFDFAHGSVFEAGDEVLVVRHGRQFRLALHDPFALDLEHLDDSGTVKAPMHGKLVAVFVKPGERVEKGQRLAVVEAMKMEHALVAPTAGEVAEVAAEPGAQVAQGAPLIRLNSEGR